MLDQQAPVAALSVTMTETIAPGALRFVSHGACRRTVVWANWASTVPGPRRLANAAVVFERERPMKFLAEHLLDHEVKLPGFFSRSKFKTVHARLRAYNEAASGELYYLDKDQRDKFSSLKQAIDDFYKGEAKLRNF